MAKNSRAKPAKHKARQFLIVLVSMSVVWTVLISAISFVVLDPFAKRKDVWLNAGRYIDPETKPDDQKIMHDGIKDLFENLTRLPLDFLLHAKAQNDPCRTLLFCFRLPEERVRIILDQAILSHQHRLAQESAAQTASLANRSNWFSLGGLALSGFALIVSFGAFLFRK